MLAAFVHSKIKLSSPSSRTTLLLGLDLLRLWIRRALEQEFLLELSQHMRVDFSVILLLVHFSLVVDVVLLYQSD